MTSIEIKRKPIQLGGKLPTDIREWVTDQFGSIRTIFIKDEPWFVGIDVANILGYKSPNAAIVKRVDTIDRWTITPNIWKSVFNSKVNTINPKISSREILNTPCDISITYNLKMRKNQPLPLRGLTFISLAGLFSLILGSQAPNAQMFKIWVTHDLIPMVYKHGAYITPETLDELNTNPDKVNELLDQLNAEKRINQQLHEENNKLKPLAEYTKDVLLSDEAITFTAFGSMFGLSAQKAAQVLQSHQIIYQRGKRWYVRVKYLHQQWFTRKTHKITFNDGRKSSKTHMYLTQKGRRDLYIMMMQWGHTPISA